MHLERSCGWQLPMTEERTKVFKACNQCNVFSNAAPTGQGRFGAGSRWRISGVTLFFWTSIYLDVNIFSSEKFARSQDYDYSMNLFLVK